MTIWSQYSQRPEKNPLGKQIWSSEVSGHLSSTQRTNQAIWKNRAAERRLPSTQPSAGWELLKFPHLGRPVSVKVSDQTAGCEHTGGSAEPWEPARAHRHTLTPRSLGPLCWQRLPPALLCLLLEPWVWLFQTESKLPHVFLDVLTLFLSE